MNYDLNKLQQLLRLRSISADNQYKDECAATANFLVDHLKEMGASAAKLVSAPGHPFVYAQFSALGKGVSDFDPAKKTILLYGHYDVQSDGDLSLWNSEPFEPKISGDKLIARGVADDKGQLFSLLEGLRFALAEGDLIYNVKVFLEGEEECGSPFTKEVVREHKELLSADIALVADTDMELEQPQILAGLRGLAMFTLKLTNASKNIHSGMYGGVVANPALELARILTTFADSKGNIMIPGFYEGITELSADVLESINNTANSQQKIAELTGAKAFIRNEKYTSQQMGTIRPTFEINGFHSGCSVGAESTIIPGYAEAVITFRLVQRQKTENLAALVEEFTREQLSEGFSLEFSTRSVNPAVMFDVAEAGFADLVEKFTHAAHGIWKNKPQVIYEGGSIPVVKDFQDILGIPTLLTGFSYADANIHGPNEYMSISQLEKGAEFFRNFLVGN